MKSFVETEAAALPSRTFEKLDSHQRMLDRMKRREENAKIEKEATEKMLARKTRESIDERVERAVTKLRGCNVGTTISLIQGMSDHERDVYLLAEEIGQNRKSVLAQFPPPRKSVRLAWANERPSTSGPATPALEEVAEGE